ncbi:unnamed protein product [Rangifer tarandus platyrhynchus]|uniref:Uncharacterized protein n=1 Tax=Rangifer tarandus platyrhynchus TaxID=3082113 RepID=A0ABN9A245_RANTA|nr:unnamed protein product [Rangifer tarandus platyrhynchus]
MLRVRQRGASEWAVPLRAERSVQRRMQRTAGRQVRFQSGDEGTGLAGQDPAKGAVTGNGRDRTPVLGPGRSALQELWRQGWENSRETSPQTPPKLSFILIFTFFLQTAFSTLATVSFFSLPERYSGEM